MMKKVVFSLFLLIGVCITSFGQGKGRKSEQVEAFKIAFFTKNLSLSSDEAKVFWPVYNDYSSSLEAVRKKRRQLEKEVKQELLSSDEKKLENLSDQYIDLKKEEHEISLTYHKKFKQVLPIRKVITLYKVEREFKQALLREIQRRRQERQNSGGRPGRMRNNKN